MADVQESAPLNFERVWTMFEETDKKFQETDKLIKELSKNIGGLNNSFGQWAEEAVSAKLWEKFRALGYTFTEGGPYEFWKDGKTVAQVDALLQNGDYLMAVEIKSVLAKEHVDKHQERLEKVRGRLDAKKDRRKLLGAVAGMVVPKDVRACAHEKGLYVVLQSGDSVTVAETPENFKAREW
jgi:hypothetical protein